MKVACPNGDFSAPEFVDLRRVDVARRTPTDDKGRFGQFLTPLSIARFMAKLVEAPGPVVRLLDAGAGNGALLANVVSELVRRPAPPERIEVEAFEIDVRLAPEIDWAFFACREECRNHGVSFDGRLHIGDFLQAAVDELERDLFTPGKRELFNCAVLNPPYFKIASNSKARRLVERLASPTSNMYTAFLAATIQWLAPRGELVAITPRSFCNGTYFRSFRKFFLERMSLRRLHIFESRNTAFEEDAVLQENIILHAVKESTTPATVAVSSSLTPDDNTFIVHQVAFPSVVQPKDRELYIRALPDEFAAEIARSFDCVDQTLANLGLAVSTGRVVEFRAREFLRDQASATDAPLLHPVHFVRGGIRWPTSATKRPNAIHVGRETQGLLIPNDNYVVVKRFTAKEERRRVVAAFYDRDQFDCPSIGIENHLNYFHQNGSGLDRNLAIGLTAYLNSSLIDQYFRQFSGHTQVNATDLRTLPYPSLTQLQAIGRELGPNAYDQAEIDRHVRLNVFSEKRLGSIDAMKKIEEALDILKSLGFPRAQLNERSALTLLALVNVRVRTPWAKVSNPLCGITPMMEFFAQHYGKRYAPNSRETVRRQTVHQFLDAGLIVANPDQPSRPTNSGNNVYQIEASALELLRSYGTSTWSRKLKAYLSARETLASRYAQERAMSRIPVIIAPGQSVSLSPGGQSVLLKLVIEEFAPRFTPGGNLVYLGDTDNKWAYFDQELLASQGVKIEAHGKMPDAVIYHQTKDWLVLVEAVTSHGPVNPKRHAELRQLFANSSSGLVFVTAFLDRKGLAAYLGDISWETEVWVADSPSHLIHFNGERFLGPYPSSPQAPLQVTTTS